ncbi:septum formation protein Maf [Vandammella animalimorsus]|uniref:dTTP/UTP pyrophosphatase n=2 Tax=Vandammella animalimorsus TaxID=2029117 RepID=A0A2A2AIN1_9BURK|nr:septum formation protein Maf [Vandammella animalimorsus]
MTEHGNAHGNGQAAPTAGPRAIYLASQSPRRSQLLQQIGIAHTLLLPDAQDTDPGDTAQALEALEAPLPGEQPLEYVQRVTRLKLHAAMRRAARRRLPPAPILCADTTVALGQQILGKPADRAQAQAMLELLCDSHPHEVLTAVAVSLPGTRTRGDYGQVQQAVSISKVRFNCLRPEWLQQYLDSGQWQGKAGAYGIQGLAATLIDRIEGSYSGIMGLPLFETHLLLQPWLRQS